jgi:hypothetical protein
MSGRDGSDNVRHAGYNVLLEVGLTSIFNAWLELNNSFREGSSNVAIFVRLVLS